MQKLLPFLLFALSLGLGAQTVRTVNFADVSGPDSPTLDQLIEQELDEADGETHFIYELERGRPFLLSGQLRYDSVFRVDIRPQAGSGAPPIILQGIGDGGTVADQLFRLGGEAELRLHGLLVSGRTDQGGYNERLVRADGENRIQVDSCLFDETGQSMFRLSGGNEKLFVSNSVFNRVGRPSNPDNGRFIDHRGDGADSVVITRCIVANVTSRFWRNGSGADAGYVMMDHNTFYNSGQHGFDFRAIEELVFTNNIVGNPIFLGRDLEGQLLDDPEETRYALEVDTFDAAEQTIIVRNNNFFVDPAVAAALPLTEAGGDTLASIDDPEAFLHPAIREAIDADEGQDSNFREVLSFGNAPMVPSQFIVANAQDTTEGNEVPAAQPFDLSNLTPFADYSGTNLGSAEPIDRYIAFYDFCYDGDTRSATAGEDGGPVGALDSTQCASLRTGVRNLAQRWELAAFPNPTTGELSARLAQTVSSDMTVELYTATGQRLLHRRLARGQQQFRLDLSDRPAGTYFLRLRNGRGGSAVRSINKR